MKLLLDNYKRIILFILVYNLINNGLYLVFLFITTQSISDSFTSYRIILNLFLSILLALILVPNFYKEKSLILSGRTSLEMLIEKLRHKDFILHKVVGNRHIFVNKKPLSKFLRLGRAKIEIIIHSDRIEIRGLDYDLDQIRKAF